MSSSPSSAEKGRDSTLLASASALATSHSKTKDASATSSCPGRISADAEPILSSDVTITLSERSTFTISARE